jgi:SOS-response transcriptional repressor LexA
MDILIIARGSIGTNILSKIGIAYPELNTNWITTGIGEMLNGEFIESISHYTSKPHIDSASAECGKPGGFSLAVKKEDCELISLPFIKDYDFSIIASGDSMINRANPSRSIQSGDIVACTIIKTKSHIRFGNIYVLSTLDGFTIKKVIESDIEGCVQCVSFNEEENFKPFNIPTSEIFDWASVVGVARINKW